MNRISAKLWLTAVLAGIVSCGGPTAEVTLSIAVCDPAAGPFSLDVTNAFFPLPVGREFVLEGTEGGSTTRLVLTVLDTVEIVAGIPTRILEERETSDGNLVEISRNFFAQAPDGTACYFGEDVDIYENGAVASHEGAWRAGVGGAVPGIIMPADPAVGVAYQQESAPGIAEDRALVTARGSRVTVPAATYDSTVTTLESTPLESGTSTKVYARGVGLIKDGPLVLLSSH